MSSCNTFMCLIVINKIWWIEPLNNNAEIEHEMLCFVYRTRVLKVFDVSSISVHATQLVWNKHACRTETYTWYLLEVIHCYDYVWLFYYIILISINMRVMNRKFNQWSMNPPIATEQTTTSHLRSLNTQKRL